MLESLSTFSIQEKKVIGQYSLAWNVNSFASDFSHATEHGGFFDLGHWQCIEIKGKDAREFLHRLSTKDVKKSTGGQTQNAAFLEGNSGFISLGKLLDLEDRFFYLVPAGELERTLDHLNMFHFAEELTILDVSDQWHCIALIEKAATSPTSLDSIEPNLYKWIDDKCNSLHGYLVPTKSIDSVINHFKTLGYRLLGQETYECLRMLSKLPQMGLEIKPGRLFLEADFIDAVDREKGCYPGQEVIERIFTYGGVNQKLMCVNIHPFPDTNGEPIELFCEGKSAGNLVSWVHFEDSTKAIGMAYIRKAFWEPKGSLQSADQKLTVELR